MAVTALADLAFIWELRECSELKPGVGVQGFGGFSVSE